MRKPIHLAWAVALLAIAATASLAETVKLSGSATVVNAVVAPNRDRIEKSSGTTLQVASNTTGRGLVDLAERSADLAMISGPPMRSCSWSTRAIQSTG